MSDTITIIHMSITFITSIVATVLGYFKFRDIHAGANKPNLEERLLKLEIQRKKDQKRLAKLENKKRK